MASTTPGVLFCKEGDEGCDNNTDGKEVIINVIEDDGNTVTPVPEGTPDHCSESVACFDFDYHRPTNHLLDMEIVIEEPAWDYDIINKMKVNTRRFYWTNTLKPKTEDEEAGIRKIHMGSRDVEVYLPTFVMHEFGHAAGLEDLYFFPGEYTDDYLMNYNFGMESIPDVDIEYLKDLYDGHSPH